MNNYDYDIKLSEDGKEKVKIAAQNLVKKNPNIDLIATSPTIRARQTAEVFAQELDYSKIVMLNEVLYMAFLNELLETITYTCDTADSMLSAGRNPPLIALSAILVGFKERFEEGVVTEVKLDCNSRTDTSKNNTKLVSYEKSL